MADIDEPHNFEQFEDEQNNKKEGDQSEQDFLNALKAMSEESEANATGKQLGFDLPEYEDDEEFKPDFTGDIQNPKEQYDLYYTIRRLLMANLPKGAKNQKLRQTVYDEKNLYLRNGVERPLDGSTVGADSRQAYLEFLRIAYSETQAWASRGGAPYDIFIEYYNLNKKMGFRK